MAFFDAQSTSVPTTYSYDTRQADIERRMKLAQALQESGQAEQPGYSYKGIQVPMSPLSGLSNVLKSGIRGWEERRAEEAQKALAQEMQDRRAAEDQKART
jgi:hypothetical protein